MRFIFRWRSNKILVNSKPINRKFQQFYQRQLASLMANTTPFQKSFFNNFYILYVCVCGSVAVLTQRITFADQGGGKKSVGNCAKCTRQEYNTSVHNNQQKNRTTNKISYLINCWWCWSSFDTGKNCNAWMMIFQFVSLTIILWWMFWNIFAFCFFSYRRRNGIKHYWFTVWNVFLWFEFFEYN